MTARWDYIWGSCEWCGADVEGDTPTDAVCTDAGCVERREWVAAVTEDGAA